MSLPGLGHLLANRLIGLADRQQNRSFTYLCSDGAQRWVALSVGAEELQEVGDWDEDASTETD